MNDDERIIEIQEQAALYALGMLAPDEAAAFERCLKVGAEANAFQALAGRLALAVQPVHPPASLRERLMARIGGHTDYAIASSGELTFVKASEGTWREMMPGIRVKVLCSDPVSRRVTALMRVAPGARYAPHRHTEAEELYVLEGGCVVAGRELRAGDYHRAEAGSIHMDTSSDDGCLLLVISSPRNEMLR